MKLNQNDIIHHLKQKLLPIYFVSGDEPLLVQEAIDAIKKTATAKGFDEKHIITTTANFKTHEFFNIANNLSLFATKKIIELQVIGNISANITKMLSEYANKVSTDIVLIIRTEKLTAAQTRTKWFMKLDKLGAHIAIWPIDSVHLPRWITNRANALGINLRADSADFLAGYTEGNLLAAAQTLEKLKLFDNKKQITPQTLENFLADHARYDIFHLVSAFIMENTERYLHILNHLQAANTEPTLILWALSKEIRLLYKMGKTKQPINIIFQQERIFGQRQNTLARALPKFPPKRCLQLFQYCAKLDRIMKGLQIGNFWESARIVLTCN